MSQYCYVHNISLNLKVLLSHIPKEGLNKFLTVFI